MRIGNFLPATEVEGPGLRAAIWFQGCSIRCINCCNPHYFSAEGGTDFTPDDLAKTVTDLPVEGITLLGGEPLDQAVELRQFIEKLRAAADMGVILFTGHAWEEILRKPEFLHAVELCDLIKAGPFIQEKHPDSRRWIGSANQTVHFITDRYSALKAAWEPARKEIEIHLRAGEIVINGTPMKNDLFFPPEER